MKQILIFLTASFMLLSFRATPGLDEVIQAFKTANASSMARYFDQTVEISLPEKTNSFSKSQAEMVLKDFISLNGIKGFNLLHKGENAGSEYFIGQMPGKVHSFRVTVFLKQKDKGLVVQEIRFENN